jgi:hypothetical protein
MKIIVENSTWNNLGDGFYQSTLFVLITKLFPEAEVFMGEGPVERAFRPKEGRLNNALKLIEHQKADIHVISGPMIRTIVRSDYRDAIKNIIEAGSSYALLSCSCNGLNGEDLAVVKSFMKKYPPISFASRDPYTYETFKDVLPFAYNGICTAFLVNKLLPIDTVDLSQKYFVSSFYRSPEPVFSSDVDEPKIEDVTVKTRKFVVPFLSWSVNRHLEIYRKDVLSSLNKFKIVRTVQGVSNKSNNFNFKYPNSFITYNPLIFLSIFKGAEFTISDRIHACAVTLAFGKPARILIKSPRCGIYDRLNIDYKTKDGFMSPVGLDKKIDLEMDLLSKYILDTFK